MDAAELALQSTRLRRFYRLLAFLTLLFAGLFLAASAWERNWVLLGIVVLLLVVATFTLVAAVVAARGRLDRSLWIFAVPLLVANLVAAFVYPSIYATLAFAPVIVVTIVLTFQSGRPFALLVVAAWLVTTATAVIGNYWVGPFPEPGGFGDLLFAVSLSVASGVAFVVLWQFEGRLRGALTALRVADQLKTDFINQAAHELSTPLTSLRIQAGLARKKAAAGQDVTQALEIVDRNSARLAGIVASITDAARIQAGQGTLQSSRFAIRHVLRRVVEAHKESAADRGVTVVWDATDAEGVGDERLISQALDALLQNAIQATTDGEVRVVARREGGEIRVEVEDSGVGFSQEESKLLFQPFQRLDSGRGKAGAGLGLYRARAIVVQHGGRIGATSAGPGRGAMFWFTLPAA